MLDCLPSNDELELILRDTVEKKFPGYRPKFEDHPVRRTSHANIHHLRISAKRPKTKRRKKRMNVQLALKTFLLVESLGDQSYIDRHDPSKLADLEARAFKWIDKEVRIPSADSSTKSYLVPAFFGYSEKHMAIATKFFYGDMLYDLLAGTSSNESFQKHFLMGVKDVARLNGLTNAPEHRFYSSSEEFKESSLANANENSASLLGNLATMYCALNPDEFIGRSPTEETSTKRTLEYVKRKKKVDLQEKVKEISAMRPSIGEPSRLQHRDCSGKNMIITRHGKYANRFVDLETFGPDSAVEDIASYCIFLARGNNAVFRSSDFPHYRHVFHAYELAWRDRDPDMVRHLDGLENGQFKEFLQPKMTGREYADLTAAFFSNAIVKTVTLAAAGARNPGNDELGIEAIAVTDPSRWHSDMNELFIAVYDMGNLINDCSNPEEVKNYFYTLGKTLTDVGYNIDQGILNAIKTGGGIGRNVMGEVPKFHK